MIELLIALAIIGVMSAVIAPSLSEILSDNRQHSAAVDVVRFARHARAQTLLTGASHMIRFSQAASNGLGTLTLFIAMNNQCSETQTQFAGNPNPPRLLDMSDFNPKTGAPARNDANRHVIFLDARLATEGAATQATVRVCYQPNGTMFAAVGTAQLAPQTQPILFTVSREISSGGTTTLRGRPRQILLPVGGNARLR